MDRANLIDIETQKEIINYFREFHDLKPSEFWKAYVSEWRKLSQLRDKILMTKPKESKQDNVVASTPSNPVYFNRITFYKRKKEAKKKRPQSDIF